MTPENVYYLVVLIAGPVIAFVILRLTLHSEAIRAKRLDTIPRFDSVRTRAPNGSTADDARKRAQASLGFRFSIIRRTTFLVLVLIWLGFLLVPTVGEVPATLISFLIAGGAVLVGIAARPLLENIISGYVITFSRQFRVGDTIMLDEHYGTIEDITPSHTIVKLWDWRRLVMPNSVMLNKQVVNYNTHDAFIWARLEFHVAYDADLDTVRETAIRLARNSHYFVGSEDPRLWIMRMERDSIKCWLAMWTRNPVDAWSIKTEVAEGLIREFRAKGIHTHLFLHNSFHASEDTSPFTPNQPEPEAYPRENTTF